MTKNAWLAHALEASIAMGTDAVSKTARMEHARTCELCAQRRRTLRANRNARDRAYAYRSCGMTKTPYGWE
jgi:hypothetical protein